MSVSHRCDRAVALADEIGAQAVYSLLAQLHAAREIAKLLPPEPEDFRAKVLEALAISEIALLRFKMELHFVDEYDEGEPAFEEELQN